MCNRDTKKTTVIRNGPDYRFDDQVDFIDIKNTFGFNTIKVGSWVSKSERLIMANIIYDALADLTLILNIPNKVIGLRNTLNLAYGTGGQLGVQAHYDANSRTLALAKNAGKGALAHEWFHAFDHYICKILFSNCNPLNFASSMWLSREIDNRHQLNLILDKLFRALFLSSSGDTQSNYLKRSIGLDKENKIFYFAKPEELAARSFEYFVASSHNIYNSYLADDIFNSTLALQGGFPNDNEANATHPLYTDYFNGLGYLLRQN